MDPAASAHVFSGEIKRLRAGATLRATWATPSSTSAVFLVDRLASVGHITSYAPIASSLSFAYIRRRLKAKNVPARSGTSPLARMAGPSAKFLKCDSVAQGDRQDGARMRKWAAGLIVVAAFVGAASTASAGTISTAFGYTGSEQTYIVPAGVESISVNAIGGQGYPAGQGAQVSGTLSVTPREQLYVEVGGNGSNGTGGFNGGGNGGSGYPGDTSGYGGGGASDVRTCSINGGSTCASGSAAASRLLVAGGGGGSAGDPGSYPSGVGGNEGSSGNAGRYDGQSGSGTAGQGGSALSGAGGPGATTPGCSAGQGKSQTNGAGGAGGADGAAVAADQCSFAGGGGGGGGGYTGGGGGGGGASYEYSPGLFDYAGAGGGAGGTSFSPNGPVAIPTGAASSVVISYNEVAANVNLTLSPTSIPADGTSSSTATASVTDVGGNGVSGENVVFSATEGAQIGPVTDNGNGTYTATLTSSTTTAGQVTVFASDYSTPSVAAGEATLTETAVLSAPSSGAGSGGGTGSGSGPGSGSGSGSGSGTGSGSPSEGGGGFPTGTGGTGSSGSGTTGGSGSGGGIGGTTGGGLGSGSVTGSGATSSTSGPQARRTVIAALAISKRQDSLIHVLAAGGITTAVRLPSPGRLVVRWYIDGSHRKKLVASGTVSASRAKRETLRLRLTPVGRKRLRTVRSIKIEVKGTFAPAHGPIETVSKLISIKR
jgi:hypothetical protein